MDVKIKILRSTINFKNFDYKYYIKFHAHKLFVVHANGAHNFFLTLTGHSCIKRMNLTYKRK